MELKTIITFIFIIVTPCSSVRLYKLFQFIEGFRAEHSHKGFLHIGYDYAVFLRTPSSHDKYLTYELYEAKNFNNTKPYQPRMITVSIIPIEYIKEQLTVYREELYSAKYVDKNGVPGTQVRTLQEWQIDKALRNHIGGVQLPQIMVSADNIINTLSQ